MILPLGTFIATSLETIVLFIMLPIVKTIFAAFLS
jgi:hypothetical protein